MGNEPGGSTPPGPPGGAAKRGHEALNAKKTVMQDGYGLCPEHWNKLFRVDKDGRIWVWCKKCKTEHEVKTKEP